MIRFACPGCKSVLSGRDEQDGQIVTCPKCGQRMQTPRLPGRTLGVRPGRTRKTSRRALIAGIVVVGMLLLVGSIWLLTHSVNHESESVVAVHETAAPPQDKPADVLPITAEKKPPQDKPPLVKSPSIEKPLPPPIDEDKKEIDLADDLPPELQFDIVDAINVQRNNAGLEPIFLDAEVSHDCQSHAEHLARHAVPLGDKPLSANDRTETIAAEAPLAAVEKWLKEPARRAAILEPRLRTFGAGFARNVAGRWISVFDWTRGLDREPPPEAMAVMGAVVYPAPGQMRVPLLFPGNETPDPLPEAKDKLAGYPITLTFPAGARLADATAHLSNKEERDIEVWLSSPEKPANPRFANVQRNTICLIAKKPLTPNTRYHVEVAAKANGESWSAKWGFTTVSAGEIHQEMAGTFLRTLNGLRRRAGLPPVPFDGERSQACAAHARYLGRNAPANPMLNWNDEKADLPAYTAEGAAVAARASIQGGGGPVQAMEGLIDSLISRPQLLDPRLRPLGLGYTPFVFGGWIWVIDLHRAVERESDKEYFYPAPDQENVPLIYPSNEVPSPIPADREDRMAGYAITALFGPRTTVTAATAKLVDDKENAVDGWLSTPANPAIADFPQRFLCFLPKKPLRPDTRYTITFQSEVNGRPWRRTWRFTTLKEAERFADDLDIKIVARVNAVRQAAGLRPVRLDAQLSRACQAHACYLALNHRHPAVRGMKVHGQDADLPGASPEGARAAKESVIAVVLDPQTCVENWMATLYHRIPILTPDLQRVGFAHARVNGRKWVCVLDTGNGRAPPTTAVPPRSRERP